MQYFWTFYSEKNIEKNTYGFYKNIEQRNCLTLILLRNVFEQQISMLEWFMKTYENSVSGINLILNCNKKKQINAALVIIRVFLQKQKNPYHPKLLNSSTLQA